MPNAYLYRPTKAVNFGNELKLMSELIPVYICYCHPPEIICRSILVSFSIICLVASC